MTETDDLELKSLDVLDGSLELTVGGGLTATRVTGGDLRIETGGLPDVSLHVHRVNHDRLDGSVRLLRMRLDG